MAKIKLVRIYKLYSSTCYDVIYESNRLCGGFTSNMPKTVKDFINNHKPQEQYNKTLKCNETIYK